MCREQPLVAFAQLQGIVRYQLANEHCDQKEKLKKVKFARSRGIKGQSLPVSLSNHEIFYE